MAGHDGVGVFNRAEAFTSQQVEWERKEARKRANRLADRRESDRVAGRIRAAYEERLATPQGLERTSRGSRGYVKPYPWMGD